MITVFGHYTRVNLPEISGFGIAPLRSQASRTALAGNVIRQVSELHASSGEASYSNTLARSLADALNSIHAATHAVTLTHRNKVYEAVMHFAPKWSAQPGKIDVDINFYVVREIL
jgi:hypothetical protein